MKYILILSFLISTRSCNEKEVKKFSRQHELNSFLAAYNKDTLAKEKKYVFIYHNVDCNSCFIGLFDSVIRIYSNDPAKKIFIFSKSDPSLISKVNLIKNSNTVFDNDNLLPQYGLSYGTDLLVKYENGVTVDYTEITNANLKKLAKMKE